MSYFCNEARKEWKVQAKEMGGEDGGLGVEDDDFEQDDEGCICSCY